MAAAKREVVPVFVPGLGNSLAGHWQRMWYEAWPGAVWVEQADWENPDCHEWVEQIQESVQGFSERPILFITHSLGGSTLAEWSAKYAADVAGAFMVAVPDVKRPGFPSHIRGYDHPPVKPLPFHSLMVISSDDPFSTEANSLKLAAQWKCEAIVLGKAGHINAESGLSDWTVGRNLLGEFLSKLGYPLPL